jgi:hypothetical protein
MVAREKMSTKPFSESLRISIALCNMTQSEAADLLEIDLNTLESWLAAGDKTWGRVPHVLVRIGALHRLRCSRGGRKGSHNWEITYPNGKTVVVDNITHWAKKQFPNKNLSSIQSSFSARGKYCGFVAKKLEQI